LTLSERQYFVWDTASQKHKMTRYARNLGGHGSLATTMISSGVTRGLIKGNRS